MKHSLGATDTHRVRSECPMRCTSSRSDVRGRGNKLRSNGVLPLGVLGMAERHRNLSVRLVAERVADARLNVRVPSFWNRKRPSLVPVVGRSPSLARDPVPIRVRDESTATAQVQNHFPRRIDRLRAGSKPFPRRVDRLRAGSIHPPATGRPSPRRFNSCAKTQRPSPCAFKTCTKTSRPSPCGFKTCAKTSRPSPCRFESFFETGRPPPPHVGFVFRDGRTVP